MSKRVLLAATGLTAALAFAPATAAPAAAPQYKVDFVGQGSYSVRADGSPC